MQAMKGGGAIILIVAAGFFAWLAVTNRLQFLGLAWNTLTAGSAGNSPGAATIPAPPPLPMLTIATPGFMPL